MRSARKSNFVGDSFVSFFACKYLISFSRKKKSKIYILQVYVGNSGVYMRMMFVRMVFYSMLLCCLFDSKTLKF